MAAQRSAQDKLFTYLRYLYVIRERAARPKGMGNLQLCALPIARRTLMLVRDIFATRPNRMISVKPEATLQDAVNLMAKERVGTVLVVDGAGDLKGILSERDLVRIMAQPGSGKRQLPVRDVATRHVITCTEDNTLQDVLTLMSNNTIRHLPVMRDGRPVGMISARDFVDAQKKNLLAALTRQKQAYGLMKRAKQEAERADRTKTEFLSNMSHELRTPLNVIIGFSEVIASQGLGRIGNDKYAEFAHEIAGAGTKLLNVIDDILAVTRLESGKWLVSDKKLDLESVISTCVGWFEETAQTKGITLETISANAPLHLIADGEMVDRMLENILSNAIKFTPEGGVITVTAELESDGALAIAVADTGIGIAPDALETALTPFGQVDGSLSRKHDGTGLGLALVNLMIKAHGGELRVESVAVDLGTTVTLRFPARRVIFAKLGRVAAS